MKKEDVYIGQKVRIRDWDDMEKEFGLDESGDINCPATFVKDMKYLCGKTAIVKDVSSINRIFLEFDNKPVSYWAYSSAMIEPICCSSYEIVW